MPFVRCATTEAYCTYYFLFRQRFPSTTAGHTPQKRCLICLSPRSFDRAIAHNDWLEIGIRTPVPFAIPETGKVIIFVT